MTLLFTPPLLLLLLNQRFCFDSNDSYSKLIIIPLFVINFIMHLNGMMPGTTIKIPTTSKLMIIKHWTDLNPHGKREKLTLEDVLFGHFPNNGSNATWVSDNEILYRDLDGTIFLYDISTDWRTVLASNFSLVSHQLVLTILSSASFYSFVSRGLRVFISLSVFYYFLLFLQHWALTSHEVSFGKEAVSVYVCLLIRIIISFFECLLVVSHVVSHVMTHFLFPYSLSCLRLDFKLKNILCLPTIDTSSWFMMFPLEEPTLTLSSIKSTTLKTASSLPLIQLQDLKYSTRLGVPKEVNW